MKGSYLFVSLLVLVPQLAEGLDPEPRAQNIVTKFLNEILGRLFEELSTKNLSVPLVDIGEAGNFTEVGVHFQGLNKTLDGVKSHGFKMNVNVTRVLFWGRYNVEHLDIPGLFPVFGRGNFSVEVDVVNLKLTLHAVRDFQLAKFNLTLPELKLQVKNSTVRFEDLMDDPYLADFLNELLSNLVPPLLETIADEVKDLLHPLLDYFGNGIFNCLTKELTTEKRLECIRNLFGTEVQPIFDKLTSDFVKRLKPHK